MSNEVKVFYDEKGKISKVVSIEFIGVMNFEKIVAKWVKRANKYHIRIRQFII